MIKDYFSIEIIYFAQILKISSKVLFISVP